MSWWTKTKSAFGIKGSEVPEIRDQYDNAHELLSDGPVLEYSRHLIDVLQNQPDSEILKKVGRPESVVPDNEVEKRNWIRHEVEKAFKFPKAQKIYKCDEFLRGKIAQTLRNSEMLGGIIQRIENIHDACEIIAANVARRYVSLYSTGTIFLKRLEAETEQLAQLPNSDIYRRFSGMPNSRIDEVPEAEHLRKAWIRDVLIGENACARLGMVTREIAFAVSQRINVGLPAVGEDLPDAYVTQTEAIPDQMPWAYYTDIALNLSQRTDDGLKKRFAGLPGIKTLNIPQQPENRSEWVKMALACEHIRKSAGIEMTIENHFSKTTIMAIEFLGIKVHEANSSGISFEGSLYLDGYRVCDILCPNSREIQTFGWNDGCSADDLGAIERYIGETGERRDGRRPDTLFDRLLDQVALHVSVEQYRKASKDCVLFLPNGTDRPVTLLSVEIPENGSREGAITHIRQNNPEAVILDDIEEEDAALIWSTVA